MSEKYYQRKLIQLIVEFLVSHVHPFPGKAPIPVGTDGTTTEQILTKLLDKDNSILNQNIRINWYLLRKSKCQLIIHTLVETTH